MLLLNDVFERIGSHIAIAAGIVLIAGADAIQNDLGVEVDRRRIEIAKPIKTAGVHPVTVSIYREIKATVNVLVGGDEIFAPEVVEEIVEVDENTVEFVDEEVAEIVEQETEEA